MMHAIYPGRLLLAGILFTLWCVPNIGHGEPPPAAESPNTYKGLSVGFTEEGHPYIGAPNAPVTVEEYSDYLCPFCGRHFTQTLPGLLEHYGSTNQLRYVFRDMPLLSLHPTAAQGSIAALCVAEQGAKAFWQIHDALFSTQQEWGRLPDPGDYLRSAAQATGVDMDAYEACIASDHVATRLQSSIEQGQSLGFNGTPSFLFSAATREGRYTLSGAYPLEHFSEWLDALLAGQAPPTPEPARPPELPFWANTQGLAPDPARPGYTLAGDPYKGSPEAALVVVEFADFQCPPCREHALATQPELDQQFVDNGKVMWVFKHLPLQEHDQALRAATAAECAGQQQRFWDMQHALFEQQDDWSNDEAEARLLALARRIGLNEAVFESCFNGRHALENVVQDMYHARGVAEVVPTFITLHDGRGGVMRGSVSALNFALRLENLLAQKRHLENEQPVDDK